MKSIKEILFPKKVAPIRWGGFRVFNVGGRVKWLFELLKR